MNQSMNHALPPPPFTMMADSSSQQGNQGENINIPDHNALHDEDSLLEKIDQHKKLDKEELRTIYRADRRGFEKHSSWKANKRTTHKR